MSAGGGAITTNTKLASLVRPAHRDRPLRHNNNNNNNNNNNQPRSAAKRRENTKSSSSSDDDDDTSGNGNGSSDDSGNGNGENDDDVNDDDDESGAKTKRSSTKSSTTKSSTKKSTKGKQPSPTMTTAATIAATAATTAAATAAAAATKKNGDKPSNGDASGQGTIGRSTSEERIVAEMTSLVAQADEKIRQRISSTENEGAANRQPSSKRVTKEKSMGKEAAKTTTPATTTTTTEKEKRNEESSAKTSNNSNSAATASASANSSSTALNAATVPSSLESLVIRGSTSGGSSSGDRAAVKEIWKGLSALLREKAVADVDDSLLAQVQRLPRDKCAELLIQIMTSEDTALVSAVFTTLTSASTRKWRQLFLFVFHQVARLENSRDQLLLANFAPAILWLHLAGSTKSEEKDLVDTCTLALYNLEVQLREARQRKAPSQKVSLVSPSIYHTPHGAILKEDFSISDSTEEYLLPEIKKIELWTRPHVILGLLMFTFDHVPCIFPSAASSLSLLFGRICTVGTPFSVVRKGAKMKDLERALCETEFGRILLHSHHLLLISRILAQLCRFPRSTSYVVNAMEMLHERAVYDMRIEVMDFASILLNVCKATAASTSPSSPTTPAAAVAGAGVGGGSGPSSP